jgi:hypothetical protein
MGKGCAQSGGGANPCSSWALRVHISTHQSLLHCTLSPVIHFNGSNGTAYTRPSKVQHRIDWRDGSEGPWIGGTDCRDRLGGMKSRDELDYMDRSDRWVVLMDEWMDGQMDGWTDGWVRISTVFLLVFTFLRVSITSCLLWDPKVEKIVWIETWANVRWIAGRVG